MLVIWKGFVVVARKEVVLPGRWGGPASLATNCTGQPRPEPREPEVLIFLKWRPMKLCRPMGLIMRNVEGQTESDFQPYYKQRDHYSLHNFNAAPDYISFQRLALRAALILHQNCQRSRKLWSIYEEPDRPGTRPGRNIFTYCEISLRAWGHGCYHW